jgi:hypothetical protein
MAGRYDMLNHFFHICHVKNDRDVVDTCHRHREKNLDSLKRLSASNPTSSLGRHGDQMPYSGSIENDTTTFI